MHVYCTGANACKCGYFSLIYTCTLEELLHKEQKLMLMWSTYLNVQGDIADGSSAIVEVDCKVV